ncbi:MAG: hypothetical protein LBG27_04030 [Spirochaetaceae bacterium]|jgi:hypothetical protein|nr:hypothetical protein [Spirochaetaceae bacterium]
MAIKTTSQDLGTAAARAGRITPGQGCWIKYQLNLCNIRYKTVAQEAGLAITSISEFIVGRKNSERTKTALRKFLGYKSFTELLAAADAANPRRKV